MSDLWGHEDPDMAVLDDEDAWRVSESDEEQRRPKRRRAPAARPTKRVAVAPSQGDDDDDCVVISDDDEPIIFELTKPATKPAAAKATAAKAGAASSNTNGSKASKGSRSSRGSKGSKRSKGDAASTGKRGATGSNNSAAEVVCLDSADENDAADDDDCEAEAGTPEPQERQQAQLDPEAAMKHLDENAAALLGKNRALLENLRRAATLEVSPSPEPPERPAPSKQQPPSSRHDGSTAEAEADLLLAHMAANRQAAGRGGAANGSTARAAAAAAAEEEGPKVTLVFNSQEHGKVKIRTGAVEPLSKAFDKYRQHAAAQGWAAKGAKKQLKFVFDGDVLKGQQTAEDLDMEDGDMVEVH